MSRQIHTYTPRVSVFFCMNEYDTGNRKSQLLVSVQYSLVSVRPREVQRMSHVQEGPNGIIPVGDILYAELKMATNLVLENSLYCLLLFQAFVRWILDTHYQYSCS
jgi:hypothetical protein